MKFSYKFWLLLTGLLFIIINLFFDDLFNHLIWIGAVFLWIILFVILIIFLIRSILRGCFKKLIWYYILFFSFCFYNPVADFAIEKWKGPVFLEAYNKGELSGVNIILRKNGKHEIQSSDFLGTNDKTTGTYKIENDKIILSAIPENETWIGDTLYIKGNFIVVKFLSNGLPDTTRDNSFLINNPNNQR